MGVRNYLIEGVSGTGKTSVCRELARRGYRAIHGDRELAYQGDPETGEPIDGAVHEHHIWDVHRVRTLVADQHEHATFFCGGSRNFSQFIDLFDEVFVLDLIVRLHRTKEDIPRGVVIDATPPIAAVVHEILRRAGLGARNAT